MAECLDFFDDSTAGDDRSSSLRGASTPGKEDLGSHCLDLTLGPSKFPGTAPSPQRQQHESVRAAPVFPFLQRHPSGNFASPSPGTVNTSHTSLVQRDGSKVPGAQHDVGAALGRQRSGNFANTGEPCFSPFGLNHTDVALPVKALLPAGNDTFPSRDQIWQTLQKSNMLFDHPQSGDDASRMWSRRAASMQVVFPKTGFDDLEEARIRRSRSNGVLAHALPRQLSNIESSPSLDCSSGEMLRHTQHSYHEDLEDLQKRKEMQAQRRLEARKRRRTLMEEKQHKISRQSSGLMHHESKQLVSPSKSQPAMTAAQNDMALESQCVSLSDSKSNKLDDLKQGPGKAYREVLRQELLEEGKTNMQVISVEKVEDRLESMLSVNGLLHVSADVYGNVFSSTMKGTLNLLPSAHGSMTSGEVEQLGDKKYDNPHTHPVSTIAGQMEIPAPRAGSGRLSLSSATDCVMNSSTLVDTAKVGDNARGIVTSSIGCAPLLFSPLQYAYVAGGTATPPVPTQPIVPVPHFMQCPVASNGESDPSLQALPNGQMPGLPSTKNFTGAFAPSSGTFLSSRTSSVTGDFVADSEGKQRNGERWSAFYPLHRTTSNPMHLSEEAHQSGSHLDFQVSVIASQLSSASNLTSDASNAKNLPLERQPSKPLGGRLMSQNSSIEDSAFSTSRQEKANPGQGGVSLLFESSTLRLGKPSFKPEEVAKQDEGSSESQLGSVHSCLDASYAQSRGIEKQKSMTISDLPWVTTTGKGPNGKTITGVLYMANGRQVRLVCSCHGKHMSPVEFVEHSGSCDLSHPERSIVVSPFPHPNYQVASTAV